MEENCDNLYGNDKLGWFKISEKEENSGLNIKWLVFFCICFNSWRLFSIKKHLLSQQCIRVLTMDSADMKNFSFKFFVFSSKMVDNKELKINFFQLFFKIRQNFRRILDPTFSFSLNAQFLFYFLILFAFYPIFFYAQPLITLAQ